MRFCMFTMCNSVLNALDQKAKADQVPQEDDFKTSWKTLPLILANPRENPTSLKLKSLDYNVWFMS